MAAEPHDALAVVGDKQDVMGLITQDDMIERGLKHDGV